MRQGGSGTARVTARCRALERTLLAALINAHIATDRGIKGGDELDYVLEARNQQRFVDFYDGHPFIHVPSVIGSPST